jgi:hypothetical protein
MSPAVVWVLLHHSFYGRFMVFFLYGGMSVILDQGALCSAGRVIYQEFGGMLPLMGDTPIAPPVTFCIAQSNFIA